MNWDAKVVITSSPGKILCPS